MCMFSIKNVIKLLLEHLYVCFVDVLHLVSSRPASQHAPRDLQYIIDKEKRLESNNNRVGAERADPGHSTNVTRTRGPTTR